MGKVKLNPLGLGNYSNEQFNRELFNKVYEFCINDPDYGAINCKSKLFAWTFYETEVYDKFHSLHPSYPLDDIAIHFHTFVKYSNMPYIIEGITDGIEELKFVKKFKLKTSRGFFG